MGVNNNRGKWATNQRGSGDLDPMRMPSGKTAPCDRCGRKCKVLTDVRDDIDGKVYALCGKCTDRLTRYVGYTKLKYHYPD